MRFSKLLIKNFRCVGPQGVEVGFAADRNVAALVGANGCGKTNILHALGIVLGVFPFQRFELEETDFFNRATDKELVIELHLQPPLKERDVYQKEYEIHGFRFRGWKKMRGDGKGTLAQEHYCFDDSGKTIVKPRRIFRKAKADEQIDNTQLPVLVQDHAWKVGSCFYLDAPSLERFFDKTTGWSPLGRLFDVYRDDFPAEHNVVKDDGGKSVPARSALEQFSGQLAGILRTKKLQEIEKKLSGRVSSYLGSPISDSFKIEFALPSHREIFEKWVDFQVAEAEGITPLPVDKLGAGHRALLRLAVIETLLDLQSNDQKYMLLIEEPEIYLHVHLRRYFSRLLRRLAKSGNQIVFTTHAPEMVDLSEPLEIVRLHKKANGCTTVRTVRPATTFDFTKAKRKLRRLGNEELLFANHALLIEGQDDQAVLQRLVEMRGIDGDVHSISVVNCDSADNIADYVMLCHQLGIDFYVIHDEDDPIQNKKRNERISSAVKAAGPAQSSLCVYTPDLESVMGLPRHCGIDQLLGFLDGKTYEQMQTDYPLLIKPIEELVVTRGLG